MTSSLKIYGILLILVILVLAIFDFQKVTIFGDDIFNATRNTQLSVIEESIEWGNLIVNDQLSIDASYAEGRWSSLMTQNISTKFNYEIAIMHTISSPPLIGVKINYLGENQLLDDVMDSYSNIVILERK